MRFQMRKDAAEWFRHVDKQFKLDFEKYYLCLMLGFASGTTRSVPASQLRDMTDTFPDTWKGQPRLLIGLLIAAHLDRMKIDYSERAAVNKQLEVLLDPDTPTKLSAVGIRYMNEYAAGGFDVLLERALTDKPRAPATLLRAYVKTLRQLLRDKDGSKHC